jgi:multidrug efflux system membrane fusion protein
MERKEMESGHPIRAAKKPRAVLLGVGAALLAGMVYFWGDNGQAQSPPAPEKNGAKEKGSAKGGGGGPVRAEYATVARADVPIYATGLGTVQAYYTVTVTPRVDGELQSLGFTEGQNVKKGDLLAQIDPRPYRATLDQATATKAKDNATLANARRDLARYQSLAPDQLTSKQVLDTAAATVSQMEAQVAADQAAIDAARTQLDYTTIRSPISGRTGIRMVDPGNIVRAASSTGIVVVTQVQPISVIFTLPASSLQAVRAALAVGNVPVSALSRDGKTELGKGVVKLIDNQVDQTTGTIRLKASFDNEDNKLWPGDFVNAKVLVQTRKDALVIPAAAVQRGQNGVFAYVVKQDNTVEARPLKVGPDAGDQTIIEGGLEPGDRVTTNNQYRLSPGAHVQLVDRQAEGKGAATGKGAGKSAAKSATTGEAPAGATPPAPGSGS